MAPLATVLIPAWNEAAVIGPTLAGLAAEGPDLRIVVIANACRDATAAVARKAAPGAVVLETPVPGKCHALNLGLAHAAANRPVVVLDADLDVTAAEIRALITPLLMGTALAACGDMRVSTAGCSPLVRAWVRAWALNPYFARGKFGGLYALAPQALGRVFPLPDLTADDEFIRRSFASHEVAHVPACRFTALAPRSLGGLIRVRRRVVRGNRALGLVRPAGEGSGGVLRAGLRHPARWADLLIFAAVALWVRLTLAIERPNPAPLWERDASTRSPPGRA